MLHDRSMAIVALIILIASTTPSIPLAEAVDRIESDPKAEPNAKANRLAQESSPYLLQHAHNPVDWYPWGVEAFERAKKEKKLIFLSIGYSSCHWCHVMERESFSNPAIAKVMNEHFVCIKVDREERPDIDDIYLTALNVMGDSGGWPLSMFLTPEGKPIFGGTYFPPEDKIREDGKMPGFRSILAKVNELLASDRAGLYKQADHVAEMTVDALERSSRGIAIVNPDRELVDKAVTAFEFDPIFGGLGNKVKEFRHAKFPKTPALSFLLSQSKRCDATLLASLDLTLRKLAEGGIYDQIGGGFHRYSTERSWLIPHFEKMLYDNAQLVELYSDAFATQPNPLYRRVVAGTLGFINREMTSKDGTFYSALDADSNGKEGEFYVWTKDEIRSQLNDHEWNLVELVYDLSKPNFEGKFNILHLARASSQIAKDLKLSEAELFASLARVNSKLLESRARRVRPFLDTKVLTSWNGQMIAAYARAGQVFAEPSYTKSAIRAAEQILSVMRGPDGRLQRVQSKAKGSTASAFLDDYAYLIHGLLNLHDSTEDQRWLQEARSLVDLSIQWYFDTRRGGFFYTAHDHEKLFARARDGFDGAQPGANGIQARNLLRVYKKTNVEKYRELGFSTIKAFIGNVKLNPTSSPGIARALQDYLELPNGNLKAEQPGLPGKPRSPRESADVVSAEFKTGSVTEGGVQEFSITLKVESPWHIYANKTENKTLIESQTTIETFIAGKMVVSTVEFPVGAIAKDTVSGEYRIYEGSVKFTGKLKRTSLDGPISVKLHLTACSEGKCLLPSVIELK